MQKNVHKSTQLKFSWLVDVLFQFLPPATTFHPLFTLSSPNSLHASNLPNTLHYLQH